MSWSIWVDPAHFLSALGLAWKAALKKTKVKLDLLTDINMLLIVEEGIADEICHTIHQFAEANNNYRKSMIKIKNICILCIGM